MHFTGQKKSTLSQGAVAVASNQPSYADEHNQKKDNGQQRDAIDMTSQPLKMVQQREEDEKLQLSTQRNYEDQGSKEIEGDPRQMTNNSELLYTKKNQLFKSSSTNSLGLLRRTDLQMTKNTRKKIQQDARKLANRVALLRISQLKTIKKIKQTEKQAQKLELRKIQNQQMFLRKQKFQQKSKRAKIVAQHRVNNVRLQRQQVVKSRQQLLSQAKHLWAKQIKEESKKLKLKKIKLQEEQHKKNCQNYKIVKRSEQKAMKQVEKSKKRNFGLSKLIKDVECSREKKKVFRITRAIKNLQQVENMLINNLKIQQDREKNAQLMLEQAYQNSAVPKKLRAASSLPPHLFKNSSPSQFQNLEQINQTNKFSRMMGDNPIDGSQRSSQTSFPNAAHQNIFSETDRNQILSQPQQVHQQSLKSFLPGDMQAQNRNIRGKVLSSQ